MPNLVNEILLDTLEKEVRDAGSCLVVSFDKLTVAQDQEVREQLREAGVRYVVVKNRLAERAFRAMDLDLRAAFQGKCGVVLAPEDKAIAAARTVREYGRRLKEPPVVVTGGVLEGEAIVGPLAAAIADMPDRQTVRAQIATAVSGPARSLASVVQAVAGGLARCVQARIDKAGGA